MKALVILSNSQLDKVTLPPRYENTGGLDNSDSGLCNQLFKIINAICEIHPLENDIYFYTFCTDINKGTYCNLNSILDLSKMRDITSFRLYDISETFDYDINNYVKYFNYVFFSYDNIRHCFNSVVKLLVFNDKFEKFSRYVINDLNLSDRLINLVHLRIDKDMENHFVNLNKIHDFYSLILNYNQAIYENCDREMPLVLLLEDTSHSVVKSLSNNFNVVFFDKNYIKQNWKNMYNEDLEGRELFALIDFIIGKNLKINNFIGFNNESASSSFSILLEEIINCNKKILV